MSLQPRLLTTILLLIAVSGVSFLLGRISNEQEKARLTLDAIALQRLIGIRSDLTSIELIREGKIDQLQRYLEQSIQSSIKTVDFGRAREALLTKDEVQKTESALDAYIAKYNEKGSKIDEIDETVRGRR